jgi:hypothetical protein
LLLAFIIAFLYKVRTTPPRVYEISGQERLLYLFLALGGATLIMLTNQLVMWGVLFCDQIDASSPEAPVSELFWGFLQLLLCNISFAGFWVLIMFARAKTTLYIPKADPVARIKLERSLIGTSVVLFIVSVSLLVGLGIYLWT